MQKLAPASLLFLLSLASEVTAFAVAGESAQPATAMVEDPCPPPLAAPQILTNLADRALNPGAPEADFSQLAHDPDVQAFRTAQQERALGARLNSAGERLFMEAGAEAGIDHRRFEPMAAQICLGERRSIY